MRVVAGCFAALALLSACAVMPRPAPSPIPDDIEVPHVEAVEDESPRAPSVDPALPAAATATNPPARPTHEILFAYRSSQVPQQAQTQLIEIAQILKADRMRHVILVAHADFQGSKEFSVALADKRANAVMTELLKLGVRRTQVRKQAIGNTRAPRGDCASDSCRQKMRRVVLQLSAPDRR